MKPYCKFTIPLSSTLNITSIKIPSIVNEFCSFNTFKNILHICIVFLFLFGLTDNSYTQLTIDAGPDTTICYGASYNGLKGYIIGGNPTAHGGVEPYTYKWSGKRVPFPSSNSIGPFYASDDLNDTTIANPVFVSDTYLDDWYTFYLEVSDGSHTTLTDSVKIRTSHFEYLLTANNTASFTIELGDSVRLPGISWVPISSYLPIDEYIITYYRIKRSNRS